MVKLSSRRGLLSLAVLLVCAIALAAWVWFQYRFPSWTEEVLLPDGRLIVVKQRRDYIEGYGTRRTWLTFSLPEMGGEHTWEAHMQPILIAVTPSREVYVVGWPSGFKQMSIYRLPRYGYVAFRWTGKAFERVPFMSVPEPLRQEENLIRCLPGQQHVDWPTKLEHGCDAHSHFVKGATRRIDLAKMEAWAQRDAKRRNVNPQSE